MSNQFTVSRIKTRTDGAITFSVRSQALGICAKHNTVTAHHARSVVRCT